MHDIHEKTLEELEYENELLRHEIRYKQEYVEKLERELLSKCKDKEAMKELISRKRSELGL